MNRMVVKIGRSFFFLDPEEIDCVEAENNYIRVHRGEKSFLIKKTLTEILNDLNSKRFIRVNRSMIVNIDRIKEMKEVENYSFKVVLDTGKSWTIRRRSKENLFKALNIQR